MVLLAVGIVCLLIAGVLALKARKALRDNWLCLERRVGDPRVAVLIPARDESAVIEGLLGSLAEQTYVVRPQDVYVIVESETDPTVEICKKYGCTVFVRRKLELQRKGYALDEVVKEILPKKHYDLYFIFDADNRLAPNYIEEMLKIYRTGYQMATGYRHAKNGNANVIAAVSALTFSMINTLGNKARMGHGANIIFSGTGCYVCGELVETWQGWPFHSLTEDYEMSLYATLNHISTFYNEAAVFYDEQPTRYTQTVDQRTRWIKGYFSARKEYVPKMRRRESANNDGSVLKERIGVWPVIFALIGVILILAEGLIWLVAGQKFGLAIGVIAGLLVAIYIILALITVVMIKREKMKFRRGVKVRAILFNPLYLLTYVYCALKAAATKNVEWKRIEHGK